MNQLIPIIIIAVIVLFFPVLWYISEAKSSLQVRRITGILAIASSFGIAYLVSSLNIFSYNAWYGGATKQLTETILVELEKGHEEKVIGELKYLNKLYQPSYENRARYDILVKEVVQRLKSKSPAPENKKDTTLSHE